jgi:hypothetical protein
MCSTVWTIYSYVSLDSRCSNDGDYEEYYFLDVTQCIRVRIYRHTASNFRVDENTKQGSACRVLGFFFDPEDRRGILIRNVGKILSQYTESHPKRQIFILRQNG